MSTLKGGLAILFITINTIACCIPIYLLALPRAVLRNEPWRVAVAAGMTRIIDVWVAGNRFLMRAIDMTHIETSVNTSAPLSRGRWYVVISNHQGWSDILVLQDVFLRRIPPLKFFVKRQLLWVPFIGFAMWLLEFPYVHRYSREALEKNPELRRHDQEATKQACEHFKRRPTSVLNFMEGTRFTMEKHARQNSKFHNLLTPKTGGFGYVVGALGQRIDQVLDVTIVYPGGVPSFWEFLSGQSPTVRVEISTRQVPAPLVEADDELAADVREELRVWVDDLWLQKDRRIDELREARR
ncbi:MAG: acetyltransferase [Gammaproteobacteria bacterium]